jgi:hypothetical protein
MTTTKQTQAAKRNVKKVQRRRCETHDRAPAAIHPGERSRRKPEEANSAAAAAHALQDRNRQQLVPGRPPRAN